MHCKIFIKKIKKVVDIKILLCYINSPETIEVFENTIGNPKEMTLKPCKRQRPTGYLNRGNENPVMG